MEQRWRIYLLGELRAEQDDRVITRFPTQKTGTLLAYLAYHLRRAHARDTLIELFWPESAPHAGRQSLSQALSSLRHLLEPPGLPAGTVLLTDRASVQLNPDAVVTDVAEFEGALDAMAQAGSYAARIPLLTQAVGLYRAELLSGFCEAWTLAERERLADRYFHALGALIQLCEADGDIAAALEYARRGVSLDPLREEAHREVIRLLLTAGQPAAALRQYRELERLLKQELHDTPARATRALVASLRSPARSRGQASGGNLPPRLTRFFGRDREIASLLDLLKGGSPERTRLITLTGPGGSGKTRLAIEVAARMQEDPDTRSVDAVWFVPLADLADPGRLLQALRDALELPRAPGQEPLEQVMAALRGGRTLLLLDNFEHLVEGGAPLVGALLAGAPALTCLVTSRRRLNLAIEREIPVPPLPAPSWTSPSSPLHASGRGGGGESFTPDALLDYPSVQLFVDRARAVRAGFAVTQDNAVAVAALCARLEGIPLAIELAAVRAQVLTPEQMLAHLEDRFRFLVSRQRDGELRHQTLWAALEWSYRLLVPEVQCFFARLSVFRGGWTLAAARAICEQDGGGSAPSRALDFLEELRECSLVEVQERAGEIRFRMLETLREFAWERLAPAEREALARRHAEYYVSLAEETEPALFGSQQALAFKQLEAEYDNLRAALAWSETAPEGLESGLRLSAALWWFWFIRAYLAEGWRWIDRALARAAEIGDTPPRAKALYGAGGIAWFRGDHATARRLMESSVAMWRRLEQPRGLAFALRAFGWVALDQGDLTVARAAVEESLGLYRELEDRVGIARSLHFLGRAAYLAGEHEEGRTLLHQGVALCRELDDDLILAWGLEALGKVALDDGNLVAVRAFYSEAMRVSERLGATRGIACALEGLAAVAALGGVNGRAARLFGAAEAYRETQGMAILPFMDWRTDYDRQVAIVRKALGEAAFSQAWAEGRSWTWEQVVAEANAPHSLPSSAGERSGASLPQVERGTVAVESGAWAGLTDAEWERLRPLLGSPSKRGRRRADDRRTLDGILYVLRTGCRWQDLPRCYGSPVTCWRRWTRWRADGTWERLRRVLPALEQY